MEYLKVWEENKMYTSMIFIMIIISVIMLVVTISLLKKKNWEMFLYRKWNSLFTFFICEEIPLSNIRNIEFELFVHVVAIVE